jgi:hypothetical protein
MPKPETVSVSTHASDTFPSTASFVAEIRSDRRLAYPAGEDKAAILHSMAPNSRRVSPRRPHRRNQPRVHLNLTLGGPGRHKNKNSYHNPEL